LKITEQTLITDILNDFRNRFKKFFSFDQKGNLNFNEIASFAQNNEFINKNDQFSDRFILINSNNEDFKQDVISISKKNKESEKGIIFLYNSLHFL